MDITKRRIEYHSPLPLCAFTDDPNISEKISLLI